MNRNSNLIVQFYVFGILLVFSGAGTGFADEPDWLAEEMKNVEDLTPLIVSAAFEEKNLSKLCEMTLDLFVEILGAKAGNLALVTLAKGGIYIGGGIPPRILPWLKKGNFLNALQSKEPHTEIISKIPVKIILNAKANLLGAGHNGLRMLADT